LGSYAQQDPTINAWLIDLLTEWHAVETAPLIEQVFSANVVDEAVHGDWENIQIALGLKAVSDTPKRSNWLFDLNAPRASLLASPQVSSANQPGTQNSQSHALTRAAKARKKSARQQAKNSRRKNRKKK
jgi:hypothetical protein